MAVRRRDRRIREKLGPEASAETDCDHDHPNEDNFQDQTLHEALPAREGRQGGEDGEGESRHGCGDRVYAEVSPSRVPS